MSERGKTRNSNFECLRILAMICIIIQHCAAHNTVHYDEVYREYFLPGLLLQWGMLGRLGVAIFILLFGYFGVEQAFNPKRILNLIIQVFTYSVLTFAVMFSIDPAFFSRKDILEAVFPISLNKYWFISVYVIFYLFTPFLNPFLKSLEKNRFRIFLMVQLVVWSIIPTLTLDNVKNYIDEIPQFFMIYCIGAYLRLYGSEIKKRTFAIFLTAGIAVYIISPVVLDLLGLRYEAFDDMGNALYTRYSVPTLFIAAGLMGLMMYKSIKSDRIINYVAGCTFGIYLFHFSVVDLLFKRFYPIDSVIDNWKKTALYILTFTVILFISGLLIESVRKVIEKAYQPAVKKLSEKIEGIVGGNL